MADINRAPQVRCDNCGAVADKYLYNQTHAHEWRRPKTWGSMRAEGGSVKPDTYGTGKDRLAFPDLCQNCADTALNAAAKALVVARKEKEPPHG